MAAVGIQNGISWNVLAAVGLEQTASWDVAAPESATSPALNPCYDDGRCGPFERVEVDFLVIGESRVTWTLRNSFTAPEPYTFQLQVGETGNPLAEDWQDVGTIESDTFTAVDVERRALGKLLDLYYRVKLTDDAAQVYYSQPATVLGRLDMRSWLQARELTRRLQMQFRSGPGGIRGFLLKRKRRGDDCPVCIDPYSGEALDSKCPTCNGTRKVAGYHTPMPCQYVDMGSDTEFEEESTDGPAGWELPTAVSARFLGAPQLATGDVWVNADSDLRYHLTRIKPENPIRGVPTSQLVRLEQLPFDNIIYRIPLKGT